MPLGYSSEAYGRSKGKHLNDAKNLDCASLDPRFPGVREYLIETSGRILREWDIDGFKFDFIDMFRVTDYTGDALTKRLGTVNLRLANGTAAVIPRCRHGARTRRASAAPQFDAKWLCASARKIKQSQNFRAAAKNNPARKFRPPETRPRILLYIARRKFYWF